MSLKVTEHAGLNLMKLPQTEHPSWHFDPRENSCCYKPDGDPFVDDVAVENLGNNFKSKTILRPPKYSMDKQERGCFIIFSQTEFDDKLELERRVEAKNDYKKMEEVAKKLGFEYVRTFAELTRNEILDHVDKISKWNHERYDAFGCAILSHGGDREDFFAKDDAIFFEEITEKFGANNCPTLGMKPKLFFIQACRGKKIDAGGTVEVKPSGRIQADAGLIDDSEKSYYMIPSQADFLIAYATTQKYISWREDDFGSWFVHYLHECVMEYGDQLEFVELMTMVNSQVCSIRTSDKKFMQSPSLVSRLCSLLYFRPKSRIFQETDYED